jgi:hypothetical protein
MVEDRDKRTLPPPQALAMVVCDHIHQDPGSGKAFILGCFSAIHSLTFPTTHPLMWLYVSLTNGRRKTKLRVELVDVNEENEPIWVDNRHTVDFLDPRMVIEVSYPIPLVTFPEPGEYRFKLFANGDFIMERRILAVPIPRREKDESDAD